MLTSQRRGRSQRLRVAGRGYALRGLATLAPAKHAPSLRNREAGRSRATVPQLPCKGRRGGAWLCEAKPPEPHLPCEAVPRLATCLKKIIMSLKVCIMAPDRVFWNATANEIILPTNTGQMGILTNHTPLITGLDIGVMLVREENSKNEWISMALMGGFALVQENTVTILVNDAELATSVNSDEAEKAFMEAQTAFEKAESRKEKIETSLTFKRARARLQLVKK